MSGPYQTSLQNHKYHHRHFNLLYSLKQTNCILSLYSVSIYMCVYLGLTNIAIVLQLQAKQINQTLEIHTDVKNKRKNVRPDKNLNMNGIRIFI